MQQQPNTWGGNRPGAGRPSGKLTAKRRVVLDFIMDRKSKNEPVLLGPMVRACGLFDRSNARRIMRELKQYGYLPE